MQGITKSPISKLKEELTKKAVAFALNGQWDEAVGCNKAILCDYPEDVGTMNRLAKSLIELNQFVEARALLTQVIEISPYNVIAKKNVSRLDKLEIIPNITKHRTKSNGDAHIFMEESGKSGTTLLKNVVSGFILETIGPGHPLSLEINKNTIEVQLLEGESLGRIEPKLSAKLIRLMNLGNRYKSAVVSANEQGVLIIIQETYRDPSSQRISGFPFKKREDSRVYLDDNLMRYMEDDDFDDQDTPDLVDDANEWES